MTLSRVRHFFYLLLRIGIVRAALYGVHRFRLLSGIYRRRLPASEWSSVRGSSIQWGRPSSCFGLPSGSVLTRWGNLDEIRMTSDRELDGMSLYFSSRWLKRPTDWKTHPLSGFRNSDVHWTCIPDFDALQGDLKFIWEPSRFDWVYRLGRAWLLSGDPRYADGFWNILEDWRRHNPPNRGVNWKCGQECAFRVIALIWGAGIFGADVEERREQLEGLWETVAKLTERIDGSIGYALAQNNNHGLSESVAIYIVGCCLPGHPKADKWRKKGRRLFIRQVLSQFEGDGSYVQHSMVYSRLALRLCFVFLVCSKKQGTSVPAAVVDRIKRAVRFLYMLQDPTTGHLPNYGANDGTNILSLSSCSYLDFRPVLQTLYYLLEGKALYQPGPYDEELAWHFGLSDKNIESLIREAPVRSNFGAQSGGYYCLRSDNGFAVARCHTYQARPSHADMLHLDLWKDGKNVAVDGGTYQYFDEKGWGTYLKSTAAHNTVLVDSASQMREYGRFLWLDWTRSRLLRFDTIRSDHGEAVGLWQGEHYGYLRRFGVIHRRCLYACRTEWLVVDDLLWKRPATRRVSLLWHLGAAEDWVLRSGVAESTELDASVRVFGSKKDRFVLRRGSGDFPRTGASSFYGELEPITLFEVSRDDDVSFRWITAIGRATVSNSSEWLEWCGVMVSLAPE